MAKLIYHIASSLDGYIAAPDGSAAQFLWQGDFIDDFLDSVRSYGAVLMGRNTYEIGYTYGLQKGQPCYTDINPNLNNYLFSKTIDVESNGQLTVVRENELEVIRNLKTTLDKPIWLSGGGRLAGSLLDAGLLDEVIIKLNPIVLGEGIRLFGDSPANKNLNLYDSKMYSNGLVRLSYRV